MIAANAAMLNDERMIELVISASLSWHVKRRSATMDSIRASGSCFGIPTTLFWNADGDVRRALIACQQAEQLIIALLIDGHRGGGDLLKVIGQFSIGFSEVSENPALGIARCGLTDCQTSLSVHAKFVDVKFDILQGSHSLSRNL
ncbi:MAG TPA: hypothetical protein VL402_02075 [Xanthobacteraceae bacterium]|jgi:hypothetical protein|nr:hypothetical protein [Xanthobacteraceae bacterium]